MGSRDHVNNLVFLDTETTGNNLLSDHLFQVCYSHQGSIHCEYFKPPLPISIKSQSITHVTNPMVADKIAFKDSPMQKDLQKILKQNILVAHNAVFDICMLSKEEVEVPQFICTLKVARFLDEANLIPEYNLQYLRYHYELDILADAHDAKSDVITLEAVFDQYYQQMIERFGDHETVIAKMVEISNNPFLFRSFNFGKHKGKLVSEVIQFDKGYLEWLLKQKMENEQAEEDWIYTLKHYLNIK